MEHNERMLALIEEGERDAAVALDDLKALWAREDEVTTANRQAVLEAHERGARDRDAARVLHGGESLFPAPEAKRSRRASSLPVTPLAALGQADAEQ